MEDINNQRIRYHIAIVLQATPVKSSMGFSQGAQGCVMLVKYIKDFSSWLLCPVRLQMRAFRVQS